MITIDELYNFITGNTNNEYVMSTDKIKRIIEYCCIFNCIDLLRFILQLDTHPSISVYTKCIVLASKYSNYEICRILLGTGYFNPSYLLFHCAVEDDINLLKVLVEFDINVRLQDDMALLTSYNCNNYRMCRLLLSYGSKSNDLTKFDKFKIYSSRIPCCAK